jgi:hypothetical protein
MSKLTDQTTIAGGSIDSALLIHVVDTTPSNASYKVALSSLSSVFVLAGGGAANQVGYFTDSDTIVGSAAYTYDGTDILLTGGAIGIGAAPTTGQFHIQESTNPAHLKIESTTTENAIMTLQKSATGGSGDENAFIAYQEDATVKFLMGMNGTGGGTPNEFVIANGDSLDADVVFVMNQTTGHAGFGLGVGGNPADVLVLGAGTTTQASLRIMAQAGTHATPLSGMLRNDAGALNWYNGSAWVDISAGGGGGASDINGLTDGYVSGDRLSLGSTNTSTGDFIVLVGTNAASSGNMTGKWNVGVGDAVLQAKTSGNGVVAIGSHAMGAALASHKSVAIGYYALYGPTNTYLNTVAIGYNAGANSTSMGSQVTIVGGTAGSVLRGNDTSLFGYNTGAVMTTSLNNTIVGAYSASNTTTGDDITILGDRINAPAATTSDYMSLEDVVRADTLAGEVYTACPAAAAADGDLNNSEVHFSVDETGHTLNIKVKYSGGTVRTATVALT